MEALINSARTRRTSLYLRFLMLCALRIKWLVEFGRIVYTLKRAERPRHFCTFCAPVGRFAYTLPTSPTGGRIEKAAIGSGRVYGGIIQRRRADGERINHRQRCGQRWRRSPSAYPRYHGYRDSALWLRLRALDALQRPQAWPLPQLGGLRAYGGSCAR